MNRPKSFANLTHFDACARAPELQLATQQFTANNSPLRSLELFNAAQQTRWVDALRAGADAAVCAQQHHDSQLTMIATQRAPANKSH